MTLDEILEFNSQYDVDDDEYNTIEIVTHNGTDFISINDIVPIKITNISPVLVGNEAIEIYDSNQSFIGVIVLPDSNKNIEEMTEYEIAAMLVDSVDQNEYLAGFLKSTYAVIAKQNLSNYIDKYYDSTPVWGKFSHKEYALNCIDTISRLTAIESINIPTDYHMENAHRLIRYDCALDRYLKKYHQFELLFDYDFVNKIKQMGDDIKDFGKIIMKYSNKDIDRLKDVVVSRTESSLNLQRLKEKMIKVANYEDISREIFQNYSKESNPIKKDDVFDYIIRENTLEYSDIRTVYNSLNQTMYDNFILKLALYWIYRVRCCIAHNRIGEYIITLDDENFVHDFAEPLIDELLLQCLIQ